MPPVPTVCRVCESACGLIATVVDGDRVELAPDREHPMSKGYACRKGLRFGEVHHHPSRVIAPQLRADRAGPFAAVGWDSAYAAIGSRLRAIRAAHGPSSVGVYLGNATGHSLGALLGASALQGALASHRQYSCLTLDNSEMFVVLERCVGSPMRTFVADYERSDCIVLFGTDPLSSQPSQAQSHPDGVRQLLRNAASLTVLDPRASATAKKAGVHLQPRPASDVFVLAWLVSEVLALGRPAPPLVAAADLASLRAATAACTLARTVAATGLAPAALTALRDRLVAAERPLVWSGLGVLLGPHGTVGWWLTLCLQALLGGVDAPGGWVANPGAIDVAAWFRRLGVRAVDPKVRSRSGHPAILGTLAAATLADDALAGDLRALIVVGGNPAISLPDTPRAQRALAGLDLLVCVDLFVNDTGSLAHAVLPATDWLERPELAVHTGHNRRVPHLQAVPAVVPPRGECRDDFDVLVGVARAAGLRPFGSRVADAAIRAGMGPETLARTVARVGGAFGWAELAAAPHGLAGPDPVGSLRRRGTDRADGMLLLAVPEFVEALTTVLDVASAAASLASSSDARDVASPAGGPRAGLVARRDGLELLLVTSVRPIETMNSWLHDGARRVPAATLHPDDLAFIGVPARIHLARADGVGLDVDVSADAGVLRGVVVLPFGWGHLAGGIGADQPGVNANVLVSTEMLEPFTGQPVSNGLRVWATASRPAGAAPSGAVVREK